jgi:3-hydroxy-3-methylglutaryl CoA synthase
MGYALHMETIGDIFWRTYMAKQKSCNQKQRLLEDEMTHARDLMDFMEKQLDAYLKKASTWAASNLRYTFSVSLPLMKRWSLRTASGDYIPDDGAYIVHITNGKMSTTIIKDIIQAKMGPSACVTLEEETGSHRPSVPREVDIQFIIDMSPVEYGSGHDVDSW